MQTFIRAITSKHLFDIYYVSSTTVCTVEEPERMEAQTCFQEFAVQALFGYDNKHYATGQHKRNRLREMTVFGDSKEACRIAHQERLHEGSSVRNQL